ncbi:TMAO reductase system sensor histidine kinase/response regulator TorS [Shewanella algae]|uniref:TMAO reductase system sensor histidine kinase/response regulator TorS n=1 Tax=Shewanella algae TaxID=38313 RepID=UPI001AADE20D|nr:TMAO reductase system sensor histidine kinase/response regulator TorS [Shewanella algae]MCE9775152.1 TMAO reductase system sensor histidine kinase/response regulator TorS [Shewanella algae]QTE96073.1 TMAO reductase system sensor histidine kinase/response regulator TorS [Shewanella algae]
MRPLSSWLSSLTGRLMLAFCLLALLLLLLVTLGNLSLYWVKGADSFLYEKALPASEAARQLSQSATSLAENAQRLGTVADEKQRQYLGRRLSLESNRMLAAIATLEQLAVPDSANLKQAAATIIAELTLLGEQTGERLERTQALKQKGLLLVQASKQADNLLRSELAVLDSVIIAKLSQIPGAAAVDDIIELDLSSAEQLNRALKLTHKIALLGQIFAAADAPQDLVGAINHSPLTDDALSPGLLKRIPVADLVRDPGRAEALEAEFARLDQVTAGQQLAEAIWQLQQQLEQRQLVISDNLKSMEQTVDAALEGQQQQLNLARRDYLVQLNWASAGLWGTGALMLLLILFVSWQVIYKGIARRLSDATQALSRLSLGDTNVSIRSYGDDELTAMASALEAFKQKTAHNQKLQQDLQRTAAELTEHKLALELKVAERTRELAQTNAQLEEASQAKSLFLATMSHEIRTPLNGLLGTLSLLGQAELPAKARQMLALSQYSGTQLQTVLNDILDFSRLEQGRLLNEPRAVELPALLNEVTAIMLAGANLAGLELRLLKPELPEWVWLDGPKLRQVLFNLLGNAIKFTAKGSVTLEVSIQDARLCFSVTDTGIGIRPEAMVHLFTPYATEATHASARGTGLGLSISRDLVQLMNGSESGDAPAIEVISTPGQGSRFSFSVPLQPCEQGEQQSSSLPQSEIAKRVLLVEDNRVNALVAQGFLAHLGHESLLCVSLAEARSVLLDNTSSPFDAVMLDLQLSDGSGSELLPELRQQLGPKVPIAAFTAQLQTQDMADYQAMGFDIVLGKPLGLQALANWLGVVSGSNQSDERHKEEDIQAPGNKVSPRNTANTQWLALEQLEQDLQVLGKATLLEMRQQFVDSSDAQLQALQAADGQLDIQAAKLHALKGSSGNMGLEALHLRCAALEQAIKTGKPLSDEELTELTDCVAASLQALDNWLEQQSD